MHKTLEMHYKDWQKALLDAVALINEEEAKQISPDYYAATTRLKMVFEIVIKNTKPPM